MTGEHESNERTPNSESLPKECFSRLKISDQYILHSDINNVSEPKVAVSLARNDILIYDIEKQVQINSFKRHSESITDIKFSQQDPEILFSSSLDGTLMQWDLREGRNVKTYYDESGSRERPFTCFHYDANEQYICAGTEVVGEDSFLVFWDKRLSKPLGGYWNSHYDEITQVQFLSSETFLASSSVDGLINIFDLSESNEDDALQNTLKTDSSVNRFCFGKSSDIVACITKDDAYQFWCTNEVKPRVLLTKKQISEDFVCDVDYLIDTFRVNNGVYLASGSNYGSIQLFSCNMKGLEIIHEFGKGHSDVIRTVSHSKNKNYFVTGGEDGILCTWRSPFK